MIGGMGGNGFIEIGRLGEERKTAEQVGTCSAVYCRFFVFVFKTGIELSRFYLYNF